MTKREFLDIVFTLVPNEANAIMDAFDEYVDSKEPHWIPVTKQMPPINEDVLVSGDGYVWKDALIPRYESNVLEWYYDGTSRDDYAWMPLPEPFKGVTE